MDSNGTQGTDAFAGAQRDARLKRGVSIVIEGEKALATLTETEYETPGQNEVPSDLTYFAHLNAKQTKSYHFVEIPKSTAIASTLSWTTLESLFSNAQVSSISQTDYQYDETYKSRGIISLPTETRVLNPTNPTDILAKSQIEYDQTGYPLINEGAAVGYDAPTGANAHLRGNATTTRTWVKDTDS